MKIKTVDQAIAYLKANEGERLVQNHTETGSYHLLFLFDEFFIEKHDEKMRFCGVECVSEETARFSLTAKYV